MIGQALTLRMEIIKQDQRRNTTSLILPQKISKSRERLVTMCLMTMVMLMMLILMTKCMMDKFRNNNLMGKSILGSGSCF